MCQQVNREEEAFLDGLSKETRLEMLRLGIKGAKAILQHVSRVEEEFLRDPVLMEGQLEQKSTESLETVSPYNHRINHAKSTKWCSMHKTATHGNEECLAQQTRKQQKTELRGDKTNRDTNSKPWNKSSLGL
ncbi:hypothetical protein ENBRE01_1736 [Enteropsectra breve]|nr:hypothetical protein ENBRE01_1736 [Enteropsectra breve]